MNYDKVKELLELVAKSPYSEFTYKEGDFELTLKKEVAKVVEVKQEEEVKVIKKQEENEEAEYIKSPLVGAFYAASSPEAKPFVSVGDEVKKGQVVGIIEAMKLMNEIESPYDGVIESILVDNEQMVEYDEALFKIRVKQ